MANHEQDDPYVPTSEEFAARERAKKERPPSNFVARVIQMMNTEIGRVRQVLAPGTAIPRPVQPSPTHELPTNEPSAQGASPLVAEQEGLGYTAQQQSLPQRVSPKVKRSINISPDVIRRRGEDVERPK
jgi:hypothetical protein